MTNANILATYFTLLKIKEMTDAHNTILCAGRLKSTQEEIAEAVGMVDINGGLFCSLQIADSLLIESIDTMEQILKEIRQDLNED